MLSELYFLTLMAKLRCPKCGRIFESTQSLALPFCSERCRLRDLGGWFKEEYSLPIESDETPDEPPQQRGDEE